MVTVKARYNASNNAVFAPNAETAERKPGVEFGTVEPFVHVAQKDSGQRE